MKRILLLISIVLICSSGLFAQLEDIDPDYLNTLNARSGKIVEAMKLSDCGHADRVRELIVIQYYELSKIHDLRDMETEKIKALEGDEKENAANRIKNEISAKFYKLHASYLAALSAELTQEQVEQVKDGMTYGVVDRTYIGYLNLLPQLTDEQKRYIRKNLLEAREFAMDAGSSKEKHGWFGKYKGRINNYLSEAGYDLKQAEIERKENKNSEK